MSYIRTEKIAPRISIPQPKKMFALYEVSNGYKFTGIVAETEEKLIEYLDETHLVKDIYDNDEPEIYPVWNKNAYVIGTIELTFI